MFNINKNYKTLEELEQKIFNLTEQLFLHQKDNHIINDQIQYNLSIMNFLKEPKRHVAIVKGIYKETKVIINDYTKTQYVVSVPENISIKDIKEDMRVALSEDNTTIERILPNVFDPRICNMMVENVPDTTYDMIGGLDEEIKLIKEAIELPLKNPEIFAAIGITQPKGVLLYGVPGTGKTLLAKAVAHHTNCKFIRMNGSELVQKYIGDGAEMIREMFKMARKSAPSIIFIDEVDCIGSKRTKDDGDNEVQRTMMELLNQLDGFNSDENVKIIMATNRMEVLDKALIRPGRIDRKIKFSEPNDKARLHILQIQTSKMNLAEDVKLEKISELLNKATGAELQGVCTEAGINALRERGRCITSKNFKDAVKCVLIQKQKEEETKKNVSMMQMWK